MATEILVESDPSTTQTKGDWIVRIGAGQGGTINSRHRQKSRAVEVARRLGRAREDRGAILKVQNKRGEWTTEATYGDVDPEGFLDGLLG